MGPRRTLVDDNRDWITGLVLACRGRSVWLVGSAARGEDNSDSDLDFLVPFELASSLFDLMDLEDALASLLGVDVDVVSVDGLKERDDHISQEALPL